MDEDMIRSDVDGLDSSEGEEDEHDGSEGEE